MSKTVVLIPYFNNLSCLTRTLQSIKHKVRIDVLVVDDGSDINQIPTISVLRHFLNKGVSLEILKLNKNRGITEALNSGLDYILKKGKHKFIARIDTGDVCVRNRFKIQEDFLLENKKVDVVGSWVNWLDFSSGNQIFCKKPPTSHKKIKKQMSVRCSIIHPSAMYRLSVVETIGKYPVKYEAAEDYAYFFNIANQGKTANIPKFLTSVEHNPAGISLSKRKQQSKSKLKVIMDYSSKNLNFFYSVPYNLFLMSLPSSTILKIKMKIFNN
jgi:glycosyltransferase involved in cell wall biosynthesis